MKKPPLIDTLFGEMYEELSLLALTLQEHLSDDGPVDTGIWADHAALIQSVLRAVNQAVDFARENGAFLPQDGAR